MRSLGAGLIVVNTRLPGRVFVHGQMPAFEPQEARRVAYEKQGWPWSSQWPHVSVMRGREHGLSLWCVVVADVHLTTFSP